MLILIAADANYSLQARVLVRSLALTQVLPTRVVVVGLNWNEELILSLRAEATNNLQIEVIKFDPKHYADVRLSAKFSLATIYNLLAADNWLKDEERFIYLDADVIVREDLSDLWSIDLSCPVGAVIDAHISMVSVPSMWRPWREEDVDPQTPYFNTGVMVIDVPKWREQDLTNRSLNLLRKYELPCLDQDALNLTLKGEFNSLKPRYNSMPYHILERFRNLDLVRGDMGVAEAITNPGIIHFHRSLLGKPWEFGCRHPGRKLWWQFANSVQPNWKRRFVPRAIAQAWIADRANMLIIDPRVSQFPTDLLPRRQNGISR